ncbi:MAG: hypothetical protein SFY70_03020 [Bacteroidia bacterium]|nr:hypothetical protein [Bacteroidia bacterium]
MAQQKLFINDNEVVFARTSKLAYIALSLVPIGFYLFKVAGAIDEDNFTWADTLGLVLILSALPVFWLLYTGLKEVFTIERAGPVLHRSLTFFGRRLQTKRVPIDLIKVVYKSKKSSLDFYVSLKTGSLMYQASVANPKNRDRLQRILDSVGASADAKIGLPEQDYTKRAH